MKTENVGSTKKASSLHSLVRFALVGQWAGVIVGTVGWWNDFRGPLHTAGFIAAMLFSPVVLWALWKRERKSNEKISREAGSKDL